MYAVIATGGKQYRVEEGQVINLEKLDGDVGNAVNFDKILMIVDDNKVNVGKPYIEGAIVSAEVLDHGRDKKVTILKFRRRKHHMKRQGHRQSYTQVKITSIGAAASPKKTRSAKAEE